MFMERRSNDSEGVSRCHKGLTVPIVKQLTLAELMCAERRLAHPLWFEFPRVGPLFVFSVSAPLPPPLSSNATRHSHTFNLRYWNKSPHHEVLAS
jgi:hypothetical protein